MKTNTRNTAGLRNDASGYREKVFMDLSVTR